MKAFLNMFIEFYSNPCHLYPVNIFAAQKKVQNATTVLRIKRIDNSVTYNIKSCWFYINADRCSTTIPLTMSLELSDSSDADGKWELFVQTVSSVFDTRVVTVPPTTSLPGFNQVVDTSTFPAVDIQRYNMEYIKIKDALVLIVRYSPVLKIVNPINSKRWD